MHDQDLAIVKALVPIAWADGTFDEPEKQMIAALLDAYGAAESERMSVLEYAAQRRTLDDIDVQDLSAGDRRLVLNHAVLMTYADGRQSAEESRILQDLSKKLRIPDDEARGVIDAGAERAKNSLGLLT
jgi:uncharacterized tellurite resistance protein B-like protein